jgi:hypothetical protein
VWRRPEPAYWDSGPGNLEQMTWTQDDWERAVASPDWGERVAQALEDYFNSGKWLLEQAKLASVSTERDPTALQCYGSSMIIGITSNSESDTVGALTAAPSLPITKTLQRPLSLQK